MKAGDVFENPITGEFGYLRVGTDESQGKLLVADLRVRPGGAVAGEHFHPIIRERFTVLSGEINYKLDGKTGIAKAGDMLDIMPGEVHDWWNAGKQEARVIVQVSPGDRFVMMALTMFGLASEGKTNKKGIPNLFQLAVTASEFKDVITFTNPPIVVQKLMFGILAPIGSLLGYKPYYDRFNNVTMRNVLVEPLPAGISIKSIAPDIVRVIP